jgi:hypothetical protein
MPCQEHDSRKSEDGTGVGEREKTADSDQQATNLTDPRTANAPDGSEPVIIA